MQKIFSYFFEQNLMNDSEIFNNLISLEGASLICGLSSAHLRRLKEKGLINGKKIGRD